MINPALDGISHINVYSQGKTELGRMLSNFTRHVVDTQDGRFKSVEGYWHWLGLEPSPETDILKRLYGYNAKKTGEALKARLPKRFDPDFEDKINYAIREKFRANAHLLKPAYADLPFEHYYVFANTGKIVDVKAKYAWMIEHITIMRDVLLKKLPWQ